MKDSLNLKKFRRSFKFGYIYIYTKEKLMVFRILSMDFINNKTIMNELDCMEFVSGDNCELMEAWEQLHREDIICILKENKK